MKKLLLFSLLTTLLGACSSTRQIASNAGKSLLDAPQLSSAHIGISVYDPAENRFLYEHQGDKYFIPASNTKLLTTYAALKYLGDSLPGLRYMQGSDGKIVIQPTGDPSFLHSDFVQQPVLDLLRNASAISVHMPESMSFQPWGRGWPWDDYDANYMPDRSVMPMYGNVVRFKYESDTFSVFPHFFYDSTDIRSVNRRRDFPRSAYRFQRDEFSNQFHGRRGVNPDYPAQGEVIPFTVRNTKQPLFVNMLADTLKKPVSLNAAAPVSVQWKTMYSQPTDSVLSIMMHRSDNFFAEQILLMAGNAMTGIMSDGKTIDTLIKTDFTGMPQKPKWADGSGLSRYNLLTPRDFVWLLTQMKNNFSWERIKAILPTGGEGTLSAYYRNYAGRIYAKTGSLSNHFALSGYLITRKGKTLIFSVMVNATMAPGADVRKGMEKFLTSIIEKY